MRTQKEKSMKFLITAVVSTFFVTGAFAQGVKAKKAWESAEKEVSEAIADMNKKCGGSTKAEIDKKSFGNDEETINVASWCYQSINGLANLCEDADYKAAMKDLKVIECKYDASIKGGSPEYGNKFELKNGKFTHTYNKDSANMGDKARNFAKDNL
jgi:hypothetical protein